MKGSPQKSKDRKRRIAKLVGVFDLVTTCPKCGGEIGIWSEEPETQCIFCQYRLFDREKTVH